MAESQEQRRQRLKELSKTQIAPARRQEPQQEGWQSGGWAGDSAVALGRGAAMLPGAATGVADIGAAALGFDRPFRRATTAVGEATGFQPGDWGESLQDRYSPQMQASQQAVEEGWEQAGEQWDDGQHFRAAGSAVGSYLRNPRSIQQLVGESLPATVAGGLVGRGVVAAAGTRPVMGQAATQLPRTPGAMTPGAAPGLAPATSRMSEQVVGQQARMSGTLGGAIGQAPVFAGMSMDQIDENVDFRRAAAAATGIGVLAGGTAFGGAAVARRLGLADPETMIAAGRNRAGRLMTPDSPRPSDRNVLARVVGGAGTEGVLQDMPQEAIEQMGKNWAEGKNLYDNVPRATLEGMLAGAAMGAGVNIPGPIMGRTPMDLTKGTDTIAAGAGSTTEGLTPDDPQGIQAAENEMLFGTYEIARSIAEEAATQHPEQAQQALETMNAIMAELDRREVPREAVSETLASKKYQKLAARQQAMQQQYQTKLQTQPQDAQRVLEKLQEVTGEMAQFEAQYSREQLIPQEVQQERGIAARAQEIAGDGAKVQRNDGRIRKDLVKRLETFESLDDAQLTESVQRGRESPRRIGGLGALGVAEAVAEQRGLSVPDAGDAPTATAETSPPAESKVRRAEPADLTEQAETVTTETVTQEDAGQAETVTQEDAGQATIWENVTEDTDARGWSDLSPLQQQAFATMVEAGADADTLAARAAQLSEMAGISEAVGGLTADQLLTNVTEQTTAGRDAAALRQVLQEQAEGQQVRSPTEEAGNRVGVSRQAIEASLRNRFGPALAREVQSRTGMELNEQQLRTLMGAVLNPQGTLEQTLADPDGASRWFDSMSTPEDMGMTAELNVDDLGDNMGTVASAGGSTAEGAGVPAADADVTDAAPTGPLSEVESAQIAAYNQARVEAILSDRQAVAYAAQVWDALREAAPRVMADWQALAQDRQAQASWVQMTQAAMESKDPAPDVRRQLVEGAQKLSRELEVTVTEYQTQTAAEPALEQAPLDAEPIAEPDAAPAIDNPMDQAPEHIVPTQELDAEVATAYMEVLDTLQPTEKRLRLLLDASGSIGLTARDMRDNLLELQQKILDREGDPLQAVETLREEVQVVAEGIEAYFDESTDANLQRTPDPVANPEVLSQQEVEQIVHEVTQNWEIVPAIFVVPTEARMPADVRETIAHHGASGEVNAHIRSRVNNEGRTVTEVFIVADRMQNRESVEEALLHEVKGHYGLRVLLQGDMARVLDRVYESYADSPELARIVDTYFTAQPFDATNADHRRLAAEELLAALAEDNLSPSLLQQVLAAINRGLRRLGFKKRIGRSELILLMHRSAQVIENGGIDVGPLAGGTVLFQRGNVLSFTQAKTRRLDQALRRSGLPAMDQIADEVSSALAEVGAYAYTEPYQTNNIQEAANQLAEAAQNSDEVSGIGTLAEQLQGLYADLRSAIDTAHQRQQAGQLGEGAEVHRAAKDALDDVSERLTRLGAWRSDDPMVQRAVETWEPRLEDAYMRWEEDAISAQEMQQLADQANNVVAGFEGAPAADPLFSSPMFSRSANMPRDNLAQKTRKAQFQAEYERLVDQAPTTFQNARTAIRDAIRQFSQSAMFTSDFVDFVGGLLPTAKDYFDTVFRQVSRRGELLTEIQNIVDPAKAFTREQRQQLNTYLAQSTMQGEWGYQPTWLDRKVTLNPELSTLWDAMDTMQQQVADGMFRHARYMHQRQFDLVQREVVRNYDEMIERAKTDTAKNKLRAEKAAELASLTKRARETREAYLPLRRWGDHVLVYRSEAFRKAQEEGRTGDVRRMKGEADHYQVHFAETSFAARQLKSALERDRPNRVFDEPFHRMETRRESELVSYDMMQKLQTEAQLSDNQKVNQQLKDAVNRLYVHSLADNTARKAELERMNTEGGGSDMVRGFADHGSSMAALASSLEINHDTRKHLAQLKADASDPTKPRRMDRSMALREIMLRHAQLLDYQESPVQNKIMAGTSIWMLLTSPAYYIQNSTQPWMLTFPWLAARYGVSAGAEMTRAYRDMRKYHRQRGKGEILDVTKVDDPHLRDLFEQLQRRGILDVGMALDLGSMAESRMWLGHKVGKAHQGMITAVRTVELYNRGVTATATYRLALKQAQQNPDLSQEQAIAQAKDAAMEAVQQTQGDYSGTNAPRLISKIPAGRILTQFRKFQLIQIGLLARTVYNTFKGEDAATKAIARRQMGYILGMHGMVGGALGLPAANIIAWAVAQALGDEDEPANAELLARRAIGNKEVADLVLRGLPAWAGVDMSTRLGMGLTFSVLPFTDMQPSRDGMLATLGTLLSGPAGGAVARGAQGVGMIQNGDVALGIGGLLPIGLNNAIKAAVYHTDGVRTRQGDQALGPEDLNWLDIATQAVGWPSKTITDRHFAFGSLRDVEQHFQQRGSTIRRAYVNAFDDNDSAGMQEAIDEWIRLQGMRRSYKVGNPQSVSRLTRAPRERMDRERLMVDGVPTRATTRDFVVELLD